MHHPHLLGFQQGLADLARNAFRAIEGHRPNPPNQLIQRLARGQFGRDEQLPLGRLAKVDYLDDVGVIGPLQLAQLPLGAFDRRERG